MADEVLPKPVEWVLRCELCSTEYPATHEGRICLNDAGKLIVADSDRVIGSVIAGRYAVESVIGVGGWSSVYLAQDRQLRRPVAIKVLHYHLRRDEVSTKRFQRESLVTASLNHPHITTMFDFGVLANGQPFIVMEYLEGSTLDVLVGFEGQISSRRTVDIICQMCDAMDHAHKKELIHRDLKPSNILLLDSGFVKIMDFGLAKCLDGMGSLTGTGNVLGTPAYMSPEQCQTNLIDARSDIYCLGLVALFMLTGRQPVQADNTYEAMHHHIAETPKRPSEVRPDLYFSPVLEDIFLRCLKKDPADRFQNCFDLKTALQAAHVLKIETPANRRLPLLSTLNNQGTAAKVSCAVLLSCFLIAALFWLSGTAGFQQSESRLQPALGEPPSSVLAGPDTLSPDVNRKTSKPDAASAQRNTKTGSSISDLGIQRNHLPQNAQQQKSKGQLQSAPTGMQTSAFAKRSAGRLPDNRAASSATTPSNVLETKAVPAAPVTSEAPASGGTVIQEAESGASLFNKPAATTDTIVQGSHLPKYWTKRFVASNLPSSTAAIEELSSVSDCMSLQIIKSKTDDRVLAYAIQQFPSLRIIALPGSNITDKGLALLASSNITTAFLRATPITDAGLLNLQRASKLVHLDLSGDHIGDAGIRNICGLPLKILGLSGTAITDQSGEFLSKMQTLEALGLEDTRFGDQGVQQIAGLPRLKELNCSQTPITDASMHHLARMPSLSVLGLSGTTVTDDGIAALSMSSSLTRLDIRNTAVTPAVIKSILRIKNLKIVRISKLSDQMAEALRNAHITVLETDRFYTSGGMYLGWRANSGQ